jgi:hypothetical protein
MTTAPLLRPSMGDRSRLLSLFDAALDLPRARIDLFARDYPCAEETLHAWARAHQHAVQRDLDAAVLRIAVEGRTLICVYLERGP